MFVLFSVLRLISVSLLIAGSLPLQKESKKTTSLQAETVTGYHYHVDLKPGVMGRLELVDIAMNLHTLLLMKC